MPYTKWLNCDKVKSRLWIRTRLPGDRIAIRSAGAYGQVMASHYNMRPIAPSVYSDRVAEAPKRKDYFASVD